MRRCIDYAIGHNINIRQSDNAAKQSEIEVNTAKWARLPLPERLCQPELNWGRTQTAVPDEETGDYSSVYVNTSSNGTNLSLSTSIPLFYGASVAQPVCLGQVEP